MLTDSGSKSPEHPKQRLADLFLVLLVFSLYLGTLAAMRVQASSLEDSAWAVHNIFALQLFYSFYCAYLWLAHSCDERICRTIMLQYFLILFVWREELPDIFPQTGVVLWNDFVAAVAILAGLHLVELPAKICFDMARKGAEWRFGKFVRAHFAYASLAIFVDTGVCLFVLAFARAHWHFWSGFSALAIFAFTLVWALINDTMLQFLRNDLIRLEEIPDNLKRLLERSGLQHVGIYVYDKSHELGYSSGFCFSLLGRRTVGLHEDLLREATAVEQDYVFAHELGHIVGHDVMRSLIFQALFICVGLSVYAWLASVGDAMEMNWTYLSDAKNLPAFFLSLHLGIFLSVWLQRAMSRSAERNADRYALELTGDAEGMIQRISRRMKEESAGKGDFVATIGRWLSLLSSTHPTDAQRIEHAQRWDEERRRTSRSTQVAAA